jgi:hypothetical protein
MSDLYQTSADLRASVADLARQERPAAALTLTRSATLSITTAGTIITWQTETRNQGFAWSGTTITIPTAGYYGISASVTATANFTTWFVLNVNSVAVCFMTTDITSVTRHSAYMQRYFDTSDAVTISLFPSINTTLSVISAGTANESPILHVVQLTGVI